jgi:hypothetical protein
MASRISDICLRRDFITRDISGYARHRDAWLKRTRHKTASPKLFTYFHSGNHIAMQNHLFVIINEYGRRACTCILLIESHCITDPFSLSLSSFYTLYHSIIMCCNPIAKTFSPFQHLQNFSCHDVISAGSFKVAELILSQLTIFRQSFHIFENECVMRGHSCKTNNENVYGEIG